MHATFFYPVPGFRLGLAFMQLMLAECDASVFTSTYGGSVSLKRREVRQGLRQGGWADGI
jgi:hypothetical protein